MTSTLLPDISVGIVLGLAAKASPVGIPLANIIDITPYVWVEQAPITIRYGRTSELDRFEAGQMGLTLRDPDRRFDPANAASPYAPYIRPMTRCWVRARFPKGSGFYQSQFEGYVDTWTPGRRVGSQQPIAVRASDGFSVLSREKFSYTVASPGELAWAAVDGILTAIGWNVGRSLTTQADTPLVARTYTDANVLSSLQEIAQAEGGGLYINRGNQVTLRDRDFRLRNRAIVATFGNPPNTADGWILGTSRLGSTTIPRAAGWVAGSVTELPFVTLSGQMDDQLIWNDIRVTRVGGVEQVASDSVSGDDYGVRTYTESTLVLTDAMALDRAGYLLGRYAEPGYRVNELTIRGDALPAVMWPLILDDLDIGVRIRIIDRVGPGQANAVVSDCRIEGITHTIEKDRWLTTYRLSNEVQYWVLEDPELGILERTARLNW